MNNKALLLLFLASASQAQITLDAEGFAGEYTAVAIGQDNLPIIAYQGDGGLRVLHCEASDCSSGTIYDHGGSATEISIAIRNDGRPLIAQYSLGSQRLELFDCADAVCSSGTRRATDAGRYSSMVIRDDGRPMIAYSRASNPRGLRVYDCTDTQCSDGTIRILDSTGVFPDIAISDGLPIISYVNGFPNTTSFKCSVAAIMTAPTEISIRLVAGLTAIATSSCRPMAYP